MRAVLFLLIGLCAASPALGWSKDGHRVVCTIAWDETTDGARKKIGVLLGISTKAEFAEACLWLESQADKRDWHTVFVPKGARAIEPARDCAKGCALTHFERSLGVLRSNADTNARTEALKTAAHLIADLHQPLNIGFAEDGGGASINGTFRGRAVTLRAMWEQELLGTILHPDSPNGFLTVYGFFSLEGRAPRGAATTPLAWTNESLWIMRTPSTGYIGNPGGLDYDDTYVKQNRRVVLEQLDKAGVRLAALLTEIFDGT